MLLLRKMQIVNLINKRTHKNFGHKRQPIPRVTVLWQGFLTFLFVGMCIEWKKIGRLIIGHENNETLPEITEEANKR